MQSVPILDLSDIQGYIVRPYGRLGFPYSRYFLFHIRRSAAGRSFIAGLRTRVTSAGRWWDGSGVVRPDSIPRPHVTLNVGLSFAGLTALGLPTRTLSRMPEEFINGMRARAHILGDAGASAAHEWDPVWQGHGSTAVHIWVSLSSQSQADGSPVPAFQDSTDWLLALADECGGVELLSGHRGACQQWQDSSAIMKTGEDGRRTPTAAEHFGFNDGISDPVFDGQYDPSEVASEVPGGGRIDTIRQAWAPLAAGEFILGQPSEAQELAEATQPWSFTRNGSFMALRKLHQNLGRFDSSIADHSALYQRVAGLASAEEARATLMAKMAGRWPSGIPLAAAATYADEQNLLAQWADIPGLRARPRPSRTAAEQARLRAFDLLLTDFRYADDTEGARCPLTAHMRRANPRDGLDPLLGSAGHQSDTNLSNRRRIMRRGMPYGDGSTRDDAGEHGVIFMALCSSLFRQFEFVQQQWLNYGASFRAGNDDDPLLGPRLSPGKFVIPVDPDGRDVPFICSGLPAFVETRGGEYFFLPSLSALRQIAQGSIDPT